MVPLPLNQVICGDCREVMAGFPDGSIDLVVTSPPYWGLRDYGDDTVAVWGGDPECKHEWMDEKMTLSHENRNFQQGTQEEVHQKTGTTFIRKYDNKTAGSCIHCGCWRGQLGLEPHPQMYIDHLVEVCCGVKRVLKPSGSFWLNLGDTYYGGGQSRGYGGKNDHKPELGDFYPRIARGLNENWCQPKQLLGIPWRVAIALQDDGWILRNCVIWYKRNHMPESVRDRLTKSYEFFFFFVKQGKYYFNLDEIREPHKPDSLKRDSYGYSTSMQGRYQIPWEKREGVVFNK